MPEFYEVESIRDKQIMDGQVYYQVKWEGYPESQNTWEPLENLKYSKTAVLQFQKRLRLKTIKDRQVPVKQTTPSDSMSGLKLLEQQSEDSFDYRDRQVKHHDRQRPQIVEMSKDKNTNQLMFLTILGKTERVWIPERRVLQKYPLELCEFYQRFVQFSE